MELSDAVNYHFFAVALHLDDSFPTFLLATVGIDWPHFVIYILHVFFICFFFNPSLCLWLNSDKGVKCTIFDGLGKICIPYKKRRK